MTEKDLFTKSIMDPLLAGNLLEREAAKMLSLSIRQIQRIKKRVHEE
jgi:transposase